MKEPSQTRSKSKKERETRPKILVADDVTANRELLCQTLEPEGYEIYLVPSGEVALKVAQSTLPDLILLDIQMPPGPDGFEICKRLKSNKLTEKFLLFS